jgi:threonine/homoserine/homoserine lactone efflux protein
MAFTDNILLFLGTVAALSTTGVMMPGPVMAAAMAKGVRSRWAGVQVALGHGVIEFPVIALIALGFSTVLKDQRVSIAIGILGGAMLIYMGISMLFSREDVRSRMRAVLTGKPKKGPAKKAKPDADPFPYHPVLAGIITTGTNPYFFLWWATLGAALILNALALGLLILVVMSVLHWSIDLGWNAFLSNAVHGSKRFWDRRAYLAVFALCGIIMLAFGAWFMASALWTVLGL